MQTIKMYIGKNAPYVEKKTIMKMWKLKLAVVVGVENCQKELHMEHVYIVVNFNNKGRKNV
jgi:hypothetical protein